MCSFPRNTFTPPSSMLLNNEHPTRRLRRRHAGPRPRRKCQSSGCRAAPSSDNCVGDNTRVTRNRVARARTYSKGTNEQELYFVNSNTVPRPGSWHLRFGAENKCNCTTSTRGVLGVQCKWCSQRVPHRPARRPRSTTVPLSPRHRRSGRQRRHERLERLELLGPPRGRVVPLVHDLG